ncbi:glutathione S-transferase [Pseudomonas alliivorans]|uniref:glutathione S-transferase n=1 Tax=Pseudomonas alliivorans TaxID=2810613 RepID=UPI001AE560FF|nr:glutathione S-transferase [Pseudomonas alliivorans]MBP0942423.1 glutathione S-transferase [Pseudomonas alliivorans]MEE4880533.1 glutathione S-transferase [Pseudomonas alliivorans]MEE4931626.1 glutathione S-transferase [Pseudomonas alliivorans]MEE4937531.1 glutathione S-transferase [Pseudomonas alliivorans]MEE4942641.1 glutathione S-transferase [Pseudomonas alliivorans]
MYTLYGARGCGSAAIEVALELCATPYTLIDDHAWEEEPGRGALKQVNPLMQVPVLVLPDGTVVTESAAILIHLGLEFPAAGLLPRAASERSQALRALVYIATNCYVPSAIIDFPERWLPDSDQKTHRKLEAGARLRLYWHWQMFSDLFTQSGSWHPEAPGAVEILASIASRWSGARDDLRGSRPTFHTSLLQIDAHPVVDTVVQRHWP